MTGAKKPPQALHRLSLQLRQWAAELGFQQLGITDTRLDEAERHHRQWLDQGYHGDMHYMEKHGSKRTRPAELVPGSQTVISVRLDYLPDGADPMELVLDEPARAYVSRYALGRDYHKLMRQRLQHLAKRMEREIGPFGYRVFTDSAPVMEKPLAQKAGLGWIGKHTNLISRERGSWFFLGEIYTDLPLEPDAPAANHCGTCRSCIDACPTGAIVAPYVLDARRCISYLTIENPGPIPVELRSLMGNRIYGCDDCQLVCPWNRFARISDETDFRPRHRLDRAGLLELFTWDEAEFLSRMEGSAIRRIGHAAWLRNLAVALGNCLAVTTDTNERNRIIGAASARADHPSAMVREHIAWALAQAEDNQE